MMYVYNQHHYCSERILVDDSRPHWHSSASLLSCSCYEVRPKIIYNNMCHSSYEYILRTIESFIGTILNNRIIRLCVVKIIISCYILYYIRIILSYIRISARPVSATTVTQQKQQQRSRTPDLPAQSPPAPESDAMGAGRQGVIDLYKTVSACYCVCARIV